jgi:hypothetical protein
MNKPKGVIAITAVLIISAGVWLILIGQAALHLNQSFMADSHNRGEALVMIAQGCLELAWRAIELNPNYGGENLSVQGHSCIINVIKNGTNYQLTVTAQSDRYYKKILAGANLINGSLAVDYWRQSE